MFTKYPSLIIMSTAIYASTASAGEILVGVGADDVLQHSDHTRAALNVDYYSDPFYTGESFDVFWGLGSQINNKGDYWLGAGVGAKYYIGDAKKWFAKLTFMPGFYNSNDDGVELHHPIEFRTMIGLGYQYTEDLSFALTLDHKSNASLGDRNPGTETVMLQVGFGI